MLRHVVYFLGALFLLESCAPLRTTEVPYTEVTPLSSNSPVDYADDVRLFFSGEVVPMVDQHIASIKVTGKKYMSDELIWNYMKHLTLRNHANALINIKTETLTRRDKHKDKDGEIYYTEYTVSELSGVAVLICELDNTWSDTYSSKYKKNIDEYMAHEQEMNSKVAGVMTIVGGVSLAILVALLPS